MLWMQLYETIKTVLYKYYTEIIKVSSKIILYRSLIYFTIYASWKKWRFFSKALIDSVTHASDISNFQFKESEVKFVYEFPAKGSWRNFSKKNLKLQKSQRDPGEIPQLEENSKKISRALKKLIHKLNSLYDPIWLQ